MNWEAKIISEAALAPYLADTNKTSFRARVTALIAEQQATWPMLREAVTGLAAVEYKKLNVSGSTVFAQFNPKRIVSTAARVDAATIKQRPCFLCADNLPPEEKGIAFGSDFIVLCNPFPVLSHHLVITSRRHTPQTIIGNFSALLDLARELGTEYFALYNGPACGASAPDHLHFQACSRERLPLLHEVETWKRHSLSRIEDGEVFTLADYRINLVIARSSGRNAISDWFQKAFTQLADLSGKSDPEPMLNLVVTYDQLGWTVYFFPRARHRPACYDAEGEARLTVSPAAIDLAGVVVVPEAAHFARISEEDLARIYSEVTLDAVRFDAWIAC